MRCAVDIAPIRAEPHEHAEQVTQALHGEPLRPLAWTRVITAYDYPGWIRSAALEPGRGSLPRAREGTPVDAPVDEARTYLGSPYEWGGMTDHGIDCSGLVHMSFRRLGTTVPRDAAEQEAAGVEITVAELRPGDLVTYGDAGRCDHVAFWLGDGRILHATGRDGLGVVEEYESKVLFARRRRLIRLASPSF